MLVEEFVAGTEVEVGVLGNRAPIASLPGEIVVTHNEWYDYEAKYDEGEMDLVVPARDRPTSRSSARRSSRCARSSPTDCEGMARADLFVRDDGEVLVNELNTIPGFTATSVYAKLFEASGIPYAELLERLVDLALERHERRALAPLLSDHVSAWIVSATRTRASSRRRRACRRPVGLRHHRVGEHGQDRAGREREHERDRVGGRVLRRARSRQAMRGLRRA